MVFWNIVIGIASFALQLILAPKPQNAKPAALEDFDFPVAEEGIEIPVVFGTEYLSAPNVTWYGDLKVKDIKGARRYGFFGPRQVIGHKYSLGMQMGLCHGPADLLYEIWAGDKLAWDGGIAGTSGGRITIDEEDLFGGEEREGGIVGDIDVCMGAPSQGQNDYLVSKLGATITAFRSLVTIVLRQVYLGTTPYIKPWQFKLQRIHLKSDGSEQWYDPKAAIPESPGLGTATGFDMALPAGSVSTRQVETKGNWAVIREAGRDATCWVWDLRDGSRRSFVIPGWDVIGGYCYITDEDLLVVRAGGEANDSDTWLQFRDLNDPDLGIVYTIDFINPLTSLSYIMSLELNCGFGANEILIGGYRYMFMQLYPIIAYSAPHVVFRKPATGGTWAIIAVDNYYQTGIGYDAFIPSWGKFAMGPNYVYVAEAGYTVTMCQWFGYTGTNVEMPEWSISPIGATPGVGGNSVATVSYNPATNEVIVVFNDGWIRVYNEDMSALLRSGCPVPSPGGWYISLGRDLTDTVLLNANSLLISAGGGYFGSVVDSFYVIDLTTLTIRTTLPVYSSSLLHKTTAMSYVTYNATHGGVVVLPIGAPTNLTFWPLIAPALDMNPSHIIRECLTDRTWGMGYTAADIDEDSFLYAADIFYDECFGLTLKWATEAPIEDFIQMVQSHVDAYLFTSRTTGKFVLKPIRHDYDVNTIPVLTEDDIVRFDDISRRQPADANTSVTVKYTDRKNRGRDSSHTFHNDAQVQQSGGVVIATRNYPGIGRGDLAARVAQRDQRSLSAGIISGRIVCKRVAETLDPGDPFRIVSTRHNLDGEIMRVAEMKYDGGRTNLITIKFVQDVFTLGAEVLLDTTQGDWENPANPPGAVDPRLVWEMPYRELVQMVGPSDTTTMLVGNPDAGMVQASGGRPTPDSLDATIYVDGISQEIMTFAPAGLIAGSIGALDTTITLTDDTDLTLLEVGMLAGIVGSTPATTEVVRIDVIDGNDLTISRGMLDTVPQSHAASAALVTYDDFGMPDYAQRTAGDTPDVQLLTRTFLGSLGIGVAPIDEVTLDSRAIRPLRPANVTVEGFAEGPVDANGMSDITVDCVERNRLTEAATISAWTDATVAPEAGQTIVIEILNPAGDTVITTHAGLTIADMPFDVPVASFDGNSTGSIRVGSERDGYREWQAYTISVLVSAEELVLDDIGLVLNSRSLVFSG